MNKQQKTFLDAKHDSKMEYNENTQPTERERERARKTECQPMNE